MNLLSTDEILAALKTGPHSIITLGIEFKALPRAIKPLLSELMEQGRVKLDRQARYTLSVKPRAVLSPKPKPQSSATPKKVTARKARPKKIEPIPNGLLQTVPPNLCGLSIAEAATKIGVNYSVLYKRLRSNDLLKDCIHDEFWYIPASVFDLVNHQRQRPKGGYTPLAAAAKKRNMDPTSLRRRLVRQGYSKYITVNNEMWVPGYALKLSDEELLLGRGARKSTRRERMKRFDALMEEQEAS